ncbi:MAG: tatA [Bacteroidetes bacterium]|nr:tatA [Bacteroidota bacterium]
MINGQYRSYELFLLHKVGFRTFEAQFLENMTSLFVLGLLGGLGAPEIIIILVIILLMFGGKKIPELMKGLGRGVKEFKDASKGESAEGTEVEKK